MTDTGPWKELKVGKWLRTPSFKQRLRAQQRIIWQPRASSTRLLSYLHAGHLFSLPLAFLSLCSWNFLPLLSGSPGFYCHWWKLSAMPSPQRAWPNPFISRVMGNRSNPRVGRGWVFCWLPPSLPFCALKARLLTTSIGCISCCCYSDLAVTKLCPTLCSPLDCSTCVRPLGRSRSPGVCPSSCPLSWWCHPTISFILCLFLLLLPSIFPSIRVLSCEFALSTRWPKYWSFSVSLSNEYSVLISFRIDWCDLLAVQGTLKSLLQLRSFKISILWHSAFFMVQLLHPYMTTGKIVALTLSAKWCFWFLMHCLSLSYLFLQGTSIF